MIDLPLPGGTVDGATVIASCWMNDEEHVGPVFAIILVLRPEPAYYEVLEIVPEQFPYRQRHRWVVHCTHGREHNIVPAARLYEERSGAWGA